jgi:hypothetical protein
MVFVLWLVGEFKAIIVMFCMGVGYFCGGLFLVFYLSVVGLYS